MRKLSKRELEEQDALLEEVRLEEFTKICSFLQLR
jgi:hypothetical protein